jgi:hypothetical protein
MNRFDPGTKSKKSHAPIATRRGSDRRVHYGLPVAVRREKARIFSGCDSRPATGHSSLACLALYSVPAIGPVSYAFACLVITLSGAAASVIPSFRFLNRLNP